MYPLFGTEEGERLHSQKFYARDHTLGEPVRVRFGCNVGWPPVVFHGRRSSRLCIRFTRLGQFSRVSSGGSLGSGDEVLRLGVMADDGGGRLLRMELEALAHLDADALGIEKFDHQSVVLESGAGRVAP